MTMDKLWAPWRNKYIRMKKQRSCLFCTAKKRKGNHYTVLKTQYSLCLLNIFPYNNGHLMVSPLRHVKDLAQLKDAELLDLLKTLIQAKKLLNKALRPRGYNIGINLSKTAGAGIAGHLHIHIVPRWVGDTNFMPIIHNTKIISQSLDDLLRLLKHARSETD